MTDSEKVTITAADVGVLHVGEPKPAVGDYMMFRGLSRQIDKVNPAKNEVHFTNPPDEPAGDRGDGTREPSRAGTCPLDELRAMKTPLGTIWYLTKTLEQKEVREGAIQMQPAVADLGAGALESALKATGGSGG